MSEKNNAFHVFSSTFLPTSSLHLVNDILTECAKAFHQDKEAKRTASGISLLVDLAIDFLVRG